MPYHSQFQEDKFIAETILPGYRGPRTFFDIGAWDGVESSNSLFFEEDLGWRGICVEPVRSAWEKCCDCRKAVNVNLVCSNKCAMSPFYVNQSAPGLSGLKSSGNMVRMTTVRADQLWFGFSELPPGIASIDTEGSELDVWEGFGKLRPHIVIMEFWTQPNPPADAVIVERMSKDGYVEAHRTEANLIFTLTK